MWSEKFLLEESFQDCGLYILSVLHLLSFSFPPPSPHPSLSFYFLSRGGIRDFVDFFFLLYSRENGTMVKNFLWLGTITCFAGVTSSAPPGSPF